MAWAGATLRIYHGKYGVSVGLERFWVKAVVKTVLNFLVA
jgi:hypothetical protein